MSLSHQSRAQYEQRTEPSTSRTSRLPRDLRRPHPHRRSSPLDRRRRSLSASTTHPIQHSVPYPLPIVARPHEDGLIASWRADSPSFRPAPSRNYPMLKNSLRASVRKFSGVVSRTSYP